MAQRGRAVAQAALAGQVARGRGEGLELVRDAVGAERASASEKCVISEISSTWGRAFSRAQAAAQVRPAVKPSRFMPAVHLQEDAVRLVRLVRGQPVDLLVAVHHMPEVQARAQLEVARLEAALEQQDGAAPAQRAQPLGLGQVEQREAVGRAQARRKTRSMPWP